MNSYGRLGIAIVLFAVLVVAIHSTSSKSALSLNANPVFTSTSNVIITPISNGYNVSNIAVYSPFVITLNGSTFKAYTYYITYNTGEVWINGSVYDLMLNKPAIIRKIPGYKFYAQLTNDSWLSKPQTIAVKFYSVPALLNPTINASYYLNYYVPFTVNVPNTTASITLTSVVSSSVRLIVTNITNSRETSKLPLNYTQLLALNISRSYNPNITSSILKIGYPCSIPAGSVSTYVLGRNGTWNSLTSFEVNISSCSVTMNITRNITVSLLQNLKYNPVVFPTVTVASTSILTTVPNSIPATHLQISSSNIELIIIVIIIIIIIVYLISRRGGKQTTLKKTIEKDQKQKPQRAAKANSNSGQAQKPLQQK